PDLAQGCLLGGLAGLHEACGEGPGAGARGDSSLAQQVLAVALDDAAGDDLRVDVVDVATPRAMQAFVGVAVGNAPGQFRGAVRAIARGVGHGQRPMRGSLRTSGSTIARTVLLSSCFWRR